MRKRIPLQGRRAPHRRFLLESLATITLACGVNAWAGQTRLAYYAVHPSEERYQVRTVPADEESARAFGSVMQTQAVQELDVSESEESIPSSSDVPVDEFIFLEPPAPEPEEDFVDDVDDVEPDLTPVPVETPFSEPVPEPFHEPFRSPLQEPVTLPAPMTSDVHDVMAPPIQMAPPTTVPVISRRSPGGLADSYLAAPNMIGDFFGSSSLLDPSSGATIALAGGDRRFKVAENVSPIPQDRVFFNFNHFNNALTDIYGVTRSLQRYTFGFEKTFFCGDASLEMRVPFSSALNSRQTIGVPDTRNAEFGNLALALKVNLLSGRKGMLSAGTTMTVPTGDDFELFQGTTGQLVVENEAVHLAPFLGWLVMPNRCWFAQGFVQADIDLNGNGVTTNAGGFEGVLQDQNQLFVDASVGRWLCRSCDPCDCLTGVAALAELHYTTTLNDTDRVAGISNPFNRMDILNATAGLNVQFRRTSVRVGGAAPITGDEERLFDAEVIFQLNRHF